MNSTFRPFARPIRVAGKTSGDAKLTTTNAAVTPMMAQYLDIKSGYPDALLFYRMGDFYELFFDDAVAAAEALDIALTKRGKHLGQDIPMCGVPVHAAENYLLTLIRKGFRVAVGEQLESPAEAKKRGSKSVVKRDVVRLVTPGTLTEDSLLEPRRNNFLAAFADIRGDGAVAWVDISTGEMRAAPCPRVRLGPELARLVPSEVLISESLFDELAEVVSETGSALTPLSRGSFDSTAAEKRLLSLFRVGSLDAFGTFSRPEIAALGALVDYLEITQKGQLPLLRAPVREMANRVMQIDAATRRNLELTETLSGAKKGSLLATIDRTLTSGGGRLLARQLSSPLTEIETLQNRLDAVTCLVSDAMLRGDLRDALKRVPDMDRALSRLAMKRGGPRDLTALRDGLKQCLTLRNLLSDPDLPVALSECSDALTGHSETQNMLEQTLIAEPPLLTRDGGFIAAGYHAELDEMRKLRDEGRKIIAEYQADYAQVC